MPQNRDQKRELYAIFCAVGSIFCAGLIFILGDQLSALLIPPIFGTGLGLVGYLSKDKHPSWATTGLSLSLGAVLVFLWAVWELGSTMKGFNL